MSYGDVQRFYKAITHIEAEEMLTTIQAAPLITGFRGEKGIHKGKIIEVMQRISMLVNDLIRKHLRK